MKFQERFAAITEINQSLAEKNTLKIGGEAEMLVTPRSLDELSEVVQYCRQENIPIRVLGSGTKVVIREQKVPGVVLELSHPEFSKVEIQGKSVRSGCRSSLLNLIAQTTVKGLAGFETLVGIAGTLGGCIRCNAGDRWGEIFPRVRRVEMLNEQGQKVIREKPNLDLLQTSGNPDHWIVLQVEFELYNDTPMAIEKRLRKSWIHRKAVFPFSFQAAIRVFKHPRNEKASNLIERAGMGKAKIGAAEISDRNANWIVAHPGARAVDILELIDKVHQAVARNCGVSLENEVVIW